ncbi:heat-inducible transcriptional repressor HrcA [Paenibacillus sp. KN14-4R]|uniref:heat-inducible transcriptional repressor HrcA n=1 Tax=Paenibacillus sp. KN14-4R TaxID=3445773 RepID=UPI003FA04109
MLSERQRMILSAIVDDYIRFAEPVGSRTISKRGNVGFSPATIRNEMSDLEEMGFLDQPHTSAGRIPSNKGYRYYVDHLVQQGALSPEEINMMKLFFTQKIQEMEDVVGHAATILSSLTNYTSIVLAPEVYGTTLKHMQIVPLSDTTAVAIFVTNTGHVENKTVTIPPGMSMSDIQTVVNLLNDRLTNVSLLEFKSKLYNEVSAELGKYVSGYHELLTVVEDVLHGGDKDRIFVSGSTNMLIQPEFKDLDKVKNILDLLGEAPKLIGLFSDTQLGVQVRIGTENTMQIMNDCSLITATYSIEDRPIGTIGILGPTRMEYGKVISVLDYVSKNLEQAFARWYKTNG